VPQAVGHDAPEPCRGLALHVVGGGAGHLDVDPEPVACLARRRWALRDRAQHRAGHRRDAQVHHRHEVQRSREQARGRVLFFDRGK
jgi:hypothetical protein